MAIYGTLTDEAFELLRYKAPGDDSPDVKFYFRNWGPDGSPSSGEFCGSIPVEYVCIDGDCSFEPIDLSTKEKMATWLAEEAKDLTICWAINYNDPELFNIAYGWVEGISGTLETYEGIWNGLPLPNIKEVGELIVYTNYQYGSDIFIDLSGLETINGDCNLQLKESLDYSLSIDLSSVTEVKGTVVVGLYHKDYLNPVLQLPSFPSLVKAYRVASTQPWPINAFPELTTLGYFDDEELEIEHSAFPKLSSITEKVVLLSESTLPITLGVDGYIEDCIVDVSVPSSLAALKTVTSAGELHVYGGGETADSLSHLINVDELSIQGGLTDISGIDRANLSLGYFNTNLKVYSKYIKNSEFDVSFFGDTLTSGRQPQLIALIREQYPQETYLHDYLLTVVPAESCDCIDPSNWSASFAGNGTLLNSMIAGDKILYFIQLTKQSNETFLDQYEIGANATTDPCVCLESSGAPLHLEPNKMNLLVTVHIGDTIPQEVTLTIGDYVA